MSSKDRAHIEEAILTILRHELFNRNAGLSVAHNVTRTIYKLEDGRVAVSVFDHGKHISEDLFNDDQTAVQRFVDLMIAAEK